MVMPWNVSGFLFFYVIFLQRPLIHIPGGLFAFLMLHAYLFSCGCVFIIYSYVKQQKTMYTQQESEWYREFVNIAFRPGGKQHTFAPFCFSQQGNMANGESSISEIPWLINQKWHCCARVRCDAYHRYLIEMHPLMQNWLAINSCCCYRRPPNSNVQLRVSLFPLQNIRSINRMMFHHIFLPIKNRYLSNTWVYCRRNDIHSGRQNKFAVRKCHH